MVYTVGSQMAVKSLQRFLVLISVRDCVDPRASVRQET
jgi:hypothetical protein